MFSFAGCDMIRVGSYNYKSSGGDWSIEIPHTYTKNKTETDDKLKITTTTFTSKSGAELDITEAIDPNLEFNKDTLSTELEMDTLIKVNAQYSVESKSGTIYMARAVDGITALNIIYVMTKINDKVITISVYQQPSFTADEEQEVKDMVETFRKIK